MYSINNCEINARDTAIYDSRATNTIQNTVTDTIIKSDRNAIYMYSSGNIKVTNSNKEIKGIIFINNANAILYISNALMNDFSLSNKGKTTIKKCTTNYINSNLSGVNVIDNSGELTLEENKITVLFTNTSSGNYDYRLIINSSTLNSSLNKYTIEHNIETKARNIYGIHNKKIFTSTSDEFNVSDGKNSYAIYNDTTSGTSDITSIKVNTFDSTNAYGIYINNGIVHLKSGEIISSGNTSYGAYINAGTLNIGTIDTSGNEVLDVSIDSPFIKAIGTTSGIGLGKTNGTINFYDGKIMGSTLPIQNNLQFNQLQPSYSVSTIQDTGTGYYYCILEHN